MARCRCSSDLCSCDIRAGAGISLSGGGTADSPLYIRADPTEVAVKDTSTVDLDVSGTGRLGDPFVLSGRATVELRDLIDVDHQGPYPNDRVLGTDFAGRLTFVEATQVAPGQVRTGDGISGDGSQNAPLALHTSGTWGQGDLAGWGSQTERGRSIYVDSAGRARSAPFPKTYRELRSTVANS